MESLPLEPSCQKLRWLNLDEANLIYELANSPGLYVIGLNNE